MLFFLVYSGDLYIVQPLITDEINGEKFTYLLFNICIVYIIRIIFKGENINNHKIL